MLCALAHSCKTDLKLPNEGLVPVSSETNDKTSFILMVQSELCNIHNYKLKVFGFEPVSFFLLQVCNAENVGKPPPLFLSVWRY